MKMQYFLKVDIWMNIGLAVFLLTLALPTSVQASPISPVAALETYSAQSAGINEENHTVDNVTAAFDALTHRGEWLGFHMGDPFIGEFAPDTYPNPTDEHIQGIARSPRTGTPIFYVTRSGNVYDPDYYGSLMVVEMGTRSMDGERLRSNRLLEGNETRTTPPHTMDRVIKNIPYNYWEHPGGIQMVGDILAVPLEKRPPAIVVTAIANNTEGFLFQTIGKTSQTITADVGPIGEATYTHVPLVTPPPIVELFSLPDIGDQFKITGTDIGDLGMIIITSGAVEVATIGTAAYNPATSEWIMPAESDVAKVIFYDCSDPRDPQQLSYELDFPDHKVGVLGITKLPDEHFLMIVTWGNNDTVEFYRSNNTSFFETGFAFGGFDQDGGFVAGQPHTTLDRAYLEQLGTGSTGTWPIDDGDWQTRNYPHQTLNFVNQTDGELFLVASRNSASTAPHFISHGDDLMYLLRVTGFGRGETVELSGIRKNAHKYLTSQGCWNTWISGLMTSSVNIQANFNAGAGAYVSPSGELLYYATSHYNKGPHGTINMAELRHNWVSSSGTCGPQFQDNHLGGPYSIDEGASINLDGEADFDGHCMMPWVQMFGDSNFLGPMVMMDFSDQFSDDYNDFPKLDGCREPAPDGFNDELSSFRFSGPPGSILLLFDDDNYRIGNTSYPLVPGTGKVIEVPFVGSYFNDEASSALLLWKGYPSQPYSWDLDNDGEFDDAVGPTATFQAGSGSSTNVVRMKYVFSDAWIFSGLGVPISFPATYAIFETIINVGNVILTVDAGPDAPIDEGSIFESSGNFTDPGPGPWEATVDYGDSSGVQSLILNLDKTFDLNHIYDDNGVYTVTANVSADDGSKGSDAAVVTVENRDPVVNAGPDISVSSVQAIDISAGFSDPGVNDNPWSFMIDWGDDSPITTGSSDIQGADTVTGAHQYFAPGFYTIIVTVIDKDGGIGTDTLQVEVESLPVKIDIKPGSETNSINPDSKGVIPVAILTDGDFDATMVQGETCRFGPGQAAPRHYAVEDVDGDEDLDMILHFSTQETGLTFSDTEATLTGQTTDDRYISGTDVVRMVPPRGKTEPKGKDDAPGQNKEPGEPAYGKGKDGAPGQNKGPGKPAEGKGKSEAPGQNKEPGEPASGNGNGNENAPGQNKEPTIPANSNGGNKDDAPGQNK
ncbi:PKD domain-containing protein [Chloroflexota bacterium]